MIAPESEPSARPSLSRDRVQMCALQMADSDGLDALSMRNLAARLGVKAMSLYHHVAGKEDVLDAITDLVIAEIALPALTGDWRVAMQTRARSAHRVMLRHPWAPLLMISRLNVGPGMLRYLDATIGCLITAGFSMPMVDHAINAIDSHIYGFTLQKLHFPLDPGSYALAAAAYLPMLPADRYPFARALTEQVAAGSHDGLNDFEFGLTLILDGLARVLATLGPIDKSAAPQNTRQ